MAATEHDPRLAELIATLFNAEERALLTRACSLLERLDNALGHAKGDSREQPRRVWV